MDPNSLVTTSLSVAAAASSLYLWVSQRRREMPRLSAVWSGHNFTYQSGYKGDDPRLLYHWIETEIFVANLSAQPNALLDLRLRVGSKDGGRPARWLSPEDSKSELTYLPLNLPPRSTVPVRVRFEIATPREVGDEVLRYLAIPTMQIEVELVGLGGRVHRAIAVEPAAPEA